MKIYFAGSIRGGRTDVGLYHRMIKHLKKEHIVLTEHVGDLSLQESTTDAEIYTQDTAWLREADLVVAECTNPSLGVGYELAYAEKYGKQVHIFYHQGRTDLSAMLTGNPYFHLHPYTDEEEIYIILDDILRIVRVTEMEKRMNRVASWQKNHVGEESVITEDIQVLRDYYQSGTWLKDFEADEAGKLPADLPRGVLSEDELYNLLEMYQSHHG